MVFATRAAATATAAVAACVCACALPGEAGAASFFVSNAGNDTATGTSADAAWRTLARASTARLGAGDSLLLQRGAVFADDFLSLAFPTGTVGAYGDASLPRPQIVRRWAPGPQTCVLLLNPSALTVEHLHIAGCTYGLVAEATADAISTNLTFRDNFFRDIRYIDQAYNPSKSSWGQAIAMRGSGTITNFTAKQNVGIRMDTFFNMQGVGVDGLDLNSNTVAKCGFNCVLISQGNDMRLRNSVFLHDTSPRLFMYGTTDVIIGTVTGDNAIESCDFNTRGEYEAGPDGCAIDFETSATGFQIVDNTIYRSWGGGIMVFGHETTSHDLNLTGNNFIYAGCVQPRGDRAGIAFMCPNGHKPTGTVADNNFATCAGVPAMSDQSPNCSDQMVKTNNRVNDGVVFAEEPQISFSPPGPDSALASVTIPTLASCASPNVTLRYTVDGSRPTPDDPEVPVAGVPLTWPGPNIVFNVKAFPLPGSGVLPSVTNGVVIERNDYRPRSGFGPWPHACDLQSAVDSVAVDNQSQVLTAAGWVVDGCSADHLGTPPASVQLRVDMAADATAVANIPRSDLVPKIAPNPEHGFTVQASANATALALSKGKHVVGVWVVDSPLSPSRLGLQCFCDGAACAC